MPHVPLDVLDRLAALEREVRQLRGRSQIRPALNQVLAGDVVIGEGGRLIVRDPDGTTVLETGQSPAAGDYYTIMRRDSGAVAFAVGNNAYADDTAPDQMVRMWSRSGAIIVMDDYYADGWLGRPCLPVPWQPTDGFDDYAGTSMATAWLSYIRAQNPVLTLRTESFASAGGTVELQLSNLTRGGGYQTVDSWSVPSNAWTAHIASYPFDGCAHFDELQLRVRHSTSGTGNITTNLLGSGTRNTFTADEVPTAP